MPEKKTKTQIKAERIESLAHLKDRWAEYQDDAKRIRRIAMLEAHERVALERQFMALAVTSALKEPDVTVADITKAMGVTRQTVQVLIDSQEENS